MSIRSARGLTTRAIWRRIWRCITRRSRIYSFARAANSGSAISCFGNSPTPSSTSPIRSGPISTPMRWTPRSRPIGDASVASAAPASKSRQPRPPKTPQLSISPTPAAGWRSSANPAAMLRERIVTGIVLAAACLAALFWLIVAPLWIWRRPSGMPSALLLALGWIVLLPAVLALVHLRNFDPTVLLLFMALVWVADIAAYFVGRRFGRFKLAPVVSPGKTWEGLAGAMAAAAVYAVVWTTVYPQATPAVLRDIPWSTGAMLLFVEVLTVLSVVGDLFESAMKRQAGLKDSGALLPGHGGILDRIDALTPVLPAAALLILI